MRDFQPNIILGFHGCTKEIGEKVIAGKEELIPSHNPYDWLGEGIYFGENDYDRAWEFAKETEKNEPFVVGAVIYLGHCLDLTQQKTFV